MVNLGRAPSPEVRTVGVDDFEAIYPLLLGFENQRMSRDDWREMCFSYKWSDEPVRGYALYAQDRPVGFLGTVFCTRSLAGRRERVCSTTSWIVEPRHRTASMLLLKTLLSLDCTIVNYTPSQRAYEVFSKLGFVPLENEQILLPPLAPPAQLLRGLSGSFTFAPSDLRRELAPSDKRIYEDLAPSRRTRHVLLRNKGRTCYLVATPSHRKNVRFADLQYVGDREFFWQNRPLAHAALLRAMGAPCIAIDARFAEGRKVPLSVRRQVRRLYRPSRADIAPVMIDGLYSELMALQA